MTKLFDPIFYYTPNSWLRLAIRSSLKKRLRFEHKRRRQFPNWENDFIQMMDKSAVAPHAKLPYQQHYEVPSDFYKYVLGPHLKYSSAFWEDDLHRMTDAKKLKWGLRKAEEKMLSLVCERSQLRDGMHILDLGCGWGSLTLYVLANFKNIRVTALSNSYAQKTFIESRAREHELDRRLNVIAGNIEAFETMERFDRIISIEMFEHMHNHRQLLEKLLGWLTDADARIFIHVFVHQSYSYLFDDYDKSSWMSQCFLSKGMMPRLGSFEAFASLVTAEQTWVVDGMHYQKTAEAWLRCHQYFKQEILDVFRKSLPGQSPKIRWWYWKLFFIACSELFGYNEGKEWFVSHYLLRRT